MSWFRSKASSAPKPTTSNRFCVLFASFILSILAPAPAASFDFREERRKAQQEAEARQVQHNAFLCWTLFVQEAERKEQKRLEKLDEDTFEKFQRAASAGDIKTMEGLCVFRLVWSCVRWSRIDCSDVQRKHEPRAAGAMCVFSVVFSVFLFRSCQIHILFVAQSTRNTAAFITFPIGIFVTRWASLRCTAPPKRTNSRLRNGWVCVFVCVLCLFSLFVSSPLFVCFVVCFRLLSIPSAALWICRFAHQWNTTHRWCSQWCTDTQKSQIWFGKR